MRGGQRLDHGERGIAPVHLPVAGNELAEGHDRLSLFGSPLLAERSGGERAGSAFGELDRLAAATSIDDIGIVELKARF